MQGAARINQEIECLEAEWRKHRFAAISKNEPPQGFNRKQASRLEMQIQALKRRKHRHSHQAHSSWKALGFLTYGVLIASFARSTNFDSFVKALVAPTPAAQAQGKSSQEKPEQAPSFEWPRKDAVPSAPEIADPALAMQKRFFGSKLGGTFTTLDAGFTNFRRLSGTLARIQAVSMKRQTLAHQLPAVWINRTRKDCFNKRSIGVYSPKCQVIKLDYTDGHTFYEHPVEMEVTIAHEWGHHLISLSEVAMSPTEQEVVSDCFAGAVFGYYTRNNLITPEEAKHAIDMVAYVGNNSAHGHHPNRETRVRSFIGGMVSVGDPSHPDAAGFKAACPGLHQIVDVARIREIGLSWKS